LTMLCAADPTACRIGAALSLYAKRTGSKRSGLMSAYQFKEALRRLAAGEMQTGSAHLRRLAGAIVAAPSGGPWPNGGARERLI
jgi:hypothetical protein